MWAGKAGADGAARAAAGMWTVSYTHLDVYKRQVYQLMSLMAAVAVLVAAPSSRVTVTS